MNLPSRLVVVGALLAFPAMASAQRLDNRRVVAAAEQYRKAAIAFEDVVNRLRGIDRTDERLVDRFEEETKQVLLASRNPRHTSRLKREIQDAFRLQDQVEERIFGKYNLDLALVRGWETVLYFQLVLLDEVQINAENPRSGGRVTRRTGSTPRPQFRIPIPVNGGQVFPRSLQR